MFVKTADSHFPLANYYDAVVIFYCDHIPIYFRCLRSIHTITQINLNSGSVAYRDSHGAEYEDDCPLG